MIKGWGKRTCGPAVADDGFTLIELMIASALAVVVLLIVGGLFTNSLTTSARVQKDTQSTSVGQLIATSVETGVRNASAVQVIVEPDGSQLLLARTAGAGASLTWSCKAWYYSKPDRAVYTTTTTPPTQITVPANGPGGSWTLLSNGVDPTDTATGQVISTTGTSVNLDYRVTAVGAPAVLIDTNIQPRNDTGESAPCF
jgi:prepilin-type N-terminal cleavage/methylation domain-containing protein